MRSAKPLQMRAAFVGAAVLLSSVVLAPMILSTGQGLLFSVLPSGYNNAVRVSNSSLMMNPRIVVGPVAANGSHSVYVLGLSPYSSWTCSANTTQNSTCTPLVVARSLDGGQSFGPPKTTSTRLPGLSVDGLALPNGTLVAASWGPWISVSTDGGTTWNVTAVLATRADPGSLARDPVTGNLYVVWASYAAWAIVPGPLYMSTSQDGGYHWSVPEMVLPSSPGGQVPGVAAYAGHVVVSFAYGTVPTYVATIASPDGGGTWSNVTPISTPVGNATVSVLVDGEPSIAVSPTGVFAIAWYRDTRNATACTPQSCDLPPTTAELVSFSLDSGSTWSSPVAAASPAGYLGPTGGHSAVFDDSGRLYAAWVTLSSDRSTESLYVASSDRSLDRFSSSSFSVTLEASTQPGFTEAEDLGVGGQGAVFLVWASSTPDGIFVRTVTGTVSGTLRGPPGPAGASPTIELRDLVTGSVVREAAWTGTAVTFDSLPPDTYGVWLVAGNSSVSYGAIPVEGWSQTSFTILTASGSPSPVEVWDVIAILAACALLFAAVQATLLYTRLAKEDVLQRKVRALIYEFIQTHPGSSFGAIRNTLALQNGGLEYHLAVLENQGFVHSELRGRHRWYFPNGNAALWKDVPLSPLQQTIVDAIRDSPGIGIRDLARKTSRRPSTVDYLVKGLAREGVLREERIGRRVQYFTSEIETPT